MLLRRYVIDFIGQMQQLSAPIYSQLPENTNFIPSGDGAYFPVRIAGNESGGGWRATDDNTLPTAGNERIKQARVRPKKCMLPIYGDIDRQTLKIAGTSLH